MFYACDCDLSDLSDLRSTDYVAMSNDAAKQAELRSHDPATLGATLGVTLGVTLAQEDTPPPSPVEVIEDGTVDTTTGEIVSEPEPAPVDYERWEI